MYEEPTDNYSESATTTNGDNIVDSTDNYYTTFDVSVPSVVFSKFWGTPGEFGITDTDGLGLVYGDSGTVVFSDVTIPAGGSFQRIVYTRIASYVVTDVEQTDIAAALATSVMGVSEFSADWVPNERLLRGIDVSIDSNWSVEAAAVPAVPALANTGSNESVATIVGFAGLALLGAGATVFALRRRMS